VEGAGGQEVKGSPTSVAGHLRRLAVGDGAVRFRARLEELGIVVPEDSSPLHRVSGACICALGIPRAGELDSSPAPYAAVVPDYLRRPDAEIALEAAAS
jgi:tRNA threonylcarbamoyladenosine biosynthesis protein TsaB